MVQSSIIWLPKFNKTCMYMYRMYSKHVNVSTAEAAGSVSATTDERKTWKQPGGGERSV